MKHFYQKIHGWFDFESTYSRMVREFDSGSHFVEIGAYYGKSSAFMAVEIANSGKNIKFDVIDTWRGSPEHQEDGWDKQEAMINDTAYDIFLQNLKPVEGYFNPIKMSSVEASKLYQDNSLDFVYIDAAHEYDFVKADIQAWYPKVKIGGILAGHDYIPSKKMFNGLVKAVNESFKEYITTVGSTWMIKKVNQ